MPVFTKSLSASTFLTPPAAEPTDAVADPDSGGCTSTVPVSIPESRVEGPGSMGMVLGLVMVEPPLVASTVTTVTCGVFGLGAAIVLPGCCGEFSVTVGAVRWFLAYWDLEATV